MLTKEVQHGREAVARHVLPHEHVLVAVARVDVQLAVPVPRSAQLVVAHDVGVGEDLVVRPRSSSARGLISDA